ncbi:MAG TPA: MFS transporter [Acidimicrobiales bacterium]
MSVRDRGDQFRRLVRASLADLFDQRKPFGRLALTHVLMTAGDTMFAVSLAGSLFFSISPTAAKDKVLLYLLLTMAPFAVVAPALGPLIDRSRGARRAMVVVSALGRAALCPFLARDFHSLLLFPEAFAMLVLSKVYLVTKGALVPEMAAQGLLDSTSLVPSTGPTSGGGPVGTVGPVGTSAPERTAAPAVGAFGASVQSDRSQATQPGQADLATLNARLGLLASLSGFVFALPAVIALKLGGAPWVVWLALVVFLAGAVAGLRLPVRRSRSIRGAPAGPEPSSVAGSTGADLVVASSSHPTSPMLGRQPFIEDLDDDEDLAPFRPIANGQVLLALVPMSALKVLVGFLTFLFAFGLRREGAATWWFGLLLGSITAGALVGVLLVSRIRRVLSEQQILVASLWLVAAFAAVGALERARLLQTIVAFAVGVAGAIAKPSFDALVQQFVPESNQGRAFARFETRLQLVWVVGAFVPVVLTLPIPAGDLVMAIFAAVTGIFYVSGRRSIRDHA